MVAHFFESSGIFHRNDRWGACRNFRKTRAIINGDCHTSCVMVRVSIKHTHDSFHARDAGLHGGSWRNHEAATGAIVNNVICLQGPGVRPMPPGAA